MDVRSIATFISVMAASVLVTNASAEKSALPALLKAVRDGNAKKAGSLVSRVTALEATQGLSEAARLGDLSVVEAMVAHGAPIPTFTRAGRITFNVKDTAGKEQATDLSWIVHLPTTPLIAAAQAGRLEVLNWLLDHGANPNSQQDAWVFTDVHQVNGVAEFRFIREDNVGNNAVSAAILAGQILAVRALVKRGADLSRLVVYQSASIPAVKAFSPEKRGLAVLLMDSNGLVQPDYGSHISLGGDGFTRTDLQIAPQKSAIIRDLLA
jgi:hypothetical protein